MIDTNKIKYMYVGDRSKAHTNVATVAYIIEEDKLLVGVSYCNSDDVYDKQYGKSLAVSRLLVERNQVSLSPVGSVAKTILDYLQAKPSRQPTWVKREVIGHKINYFVEHETTHQLALAECQLALMQNCGMSYSEAKSIEPGIITKIFKILFEK